MPRAPKLGRQKNGEYTYWGAMIGGKRLRFGRVDEVAFTVANKAFLKAIVAHDEENGTPVKEDAKIGDKAISVHDMCLKHFEWHGSQNKANTASNRVGFLDRFCDHVYRGSQLGVLPAASITKEHLAVFMATFKEDGWTTWNYAVAVKAAFNWGYREGFITENHLSKYPLPPQPKADVSEATLMTREEVNWFLEKGEHYGAGPILRVLYATGARPGEMCSALVSDYITKSRQLRLLNWKNGKKTNVARRIPLPDDAAKIVSRLCKELSPSACIFSGPNGAAWTPNRLQKIFRKIREGDWRHKTTGGRFERLTDKEAKKRAQDTRQRDELSLYDLRHLWISDALQQGIPVATIATMAGTSIQMIEKTYGHFRCDDLRAIANKIADGRTI